MLALEPMGLEHFFKAFRRVQVSPFPGQLRLLEPRIGCTDVGTKHPTTFSEEQSEFGDHEVDSSLIKEMEDATDVNEIKLALEMIQRRKRTCGGRRELRWVEDVADDDGRRESGGSVLEELMAELDEF